METFPLYASITLALTTLLTAWFFYRASSQSKPVFIILVSWMLIQAVAGLTGFYQDTNSLPPRFILAIGPPVVFIFILFLTPFGRRFLDSLNAKMLTLLHVIRIPVEIVLFWLFLYRGIPEIMTFEGRNFDIISGLTAPVIYYFGFVRKKLSAGIVLSWNILCLLLLINIVTIAILSTPYPFQKFGFDQPNVAIFYFPFVWLPSLIVPIVLLSQLAVIRRLVIKRKSVLSRDAQVALVS